MSSILHTGLSLMGAPCRRTGQGIGEGEAWQVTNWSAESIPDRFAMRVT